MTKIEHSTRTVKTYDARLIVGFDGTMAVIDGNALRKPRLFDLAVMHRPNHRIAVYRDMEG